MGDYQVNEASVGVRVRLTKGVLGLDCCLVGILIRECKSTPFDFTQLCRRESSWAWKTGLNLILYVLSKPASILIRVALYMLCV